MFGLPRARFIVLGLAALGVGLSLLLWPRRAPTDGYAEAIVKAHTRKMAQDAQALRAADSALAHRDGTVTRTIVKYHTLRDTLDIHDTVQVKVFVERSDSVVRACTELQSACSIYRVRAESVIAGLTQDRDAWKFAADKAKPSGLSKAWDRVRLPLAFVGGVYLGSRITR